MEINNSQIVQKYMSFLAQKKISGAVQDEQNYYKYRSEKALI